MRVVKEKVNTSSEYPYFESNKELILSRVDFNLFLKLKNVLNEVFGEENNQIKDPFDNNFFRECNRSYGDFKQLSSKDLISIINNLLLTVEIRFPEIEITNSRNIKRKIYDLFVKFSLDMNFKLKQNISGAVTTFTKESFATGYNHSHLATGIRDGWAGFCIGSETPMAMLSTKWMSTPFSEGEMKLYMLSLKEYVKWESLEGGPYIEIGKLSATYTQIIKNYSHRPGVRFNTDLTKTDIENQATRYSIEKVMSHWLKERIISNLDNKQFRDDLIHKFFTFDIVNNEVVLTYSVLFDKWATNQMLSMLDEFKEKYQPTSGTPEYMMQRANFFNTQAPKIWGNYTSTTMNYQALPKYLNDSYAILAVDENGRYGQSPFYYKKYVDFNYEFLGTTTNNIPSQFDPYKGRKVITFKGTDYRIKVLEDSVPVSAEEIAAKQAEFENLASKVNYTINPKILKNVTDEFANLTTNAYIASCSASELKNTSTNIRETTTADISTLLGS